MGKESGEMSPLDYNSFLDDVRAIKQKAGEEIDEITYGASYRKHYLFGRYDAAQDIINLFISRFENS